VRSTARQVTPYRGVFPRLRLRLEGLLFEPDVEAVFRVPHEPPDLHRRRPLTLASPIRKSLEGQARALRYLTRSENASLHADANSKGGLSSSKAGTPKWREIADSSSMVKEEIPLRRRFKVECGIAVLSDRDSMVSPRTASSALMLRVALLLNGS